jgi:hypothetical protein
MFESLSSLIGLTGQRVFFDDRQINWANLCVNWELLW